MAPVSCDIRPALGDMAPAAWEMPPAPWEMAPALCDTAPASSQMPPAALFALPFELQPLDAFEKLAIWSEGGADVGFDQQRLVHYTVIIQVEQLVA